MLVTIDFNLKIIMTVKYERRDKIGYFTIDNGKVNCFTPQMHKDLFFFLKEFEIDQEVSVGIIRGAAGKCFSAGDDIKNVLDNKRTPQQELEAYLFLHQNEDNNPSRPGWDIDVLHFRRYKPIIAAINSYCLGKGLIYVLLHSDIRIASENAKFGLPEIAYGMAGASGSTRLARQLSLVDAAWLSLTGEMIDAKEALRVNLINKIVDVDNLFEEADNAAHLIARHPQIAIRIEMEAMSLGIEQTKENAVRNTQNLYRLQRACYQGFGSDPSEILIKNKGKDENDIR